ncbi:MAG: ABC transporter permease [Lachnospiraceae bacterium]|nr:ABC transporter permease [Lachnospiraceae bacterium]
MWKYFSALFKKDCRLLASGKFFLLTAGFLALYTAYINFGYIRFLKMPIYNVYLYDPTGTQTETSSQIKTVTSRKALDAALKTDDNGVGLDASSGEIKVLLYRGAPPVDRHRADYALSLLQPAAFVSPEKIGAFAPEEKARREITCELLFFELSAVGFLGIAAVLFKEKGMGVIRVHAVLPFSKNLFLASKLAVFLLCDLCFAALLTLFNVGAGGIAILPAVLLQTAILSLVMALAGLGFSLLLKDFRTFTLVYLLLAVFAATPVFLSANTSVKFGWIDFHPFYHFFMGLKNAYFQTPAARPLYYICSVGAIGLLFLGVQFAFHREMGKEA